MNIIVLKCMFYLLQRILVEVHTGKEQTIVPTAGDIVTGKLVSFLENHE